MVRMTATDAARSFSELLDRVANGEEIEVTRQLQERFGACAAPRRIGVVL
jgi:hypothetical protein